MSRLWRCWLCGIAIFLGSMQCWAQDKTDSDVGEMEIGQTNRRGEIFYIFGRVLTIGGDPIHAATVQLNIGSTEKGRQTMTTNLQGMFETEIDPDSIKSTRLQGTLVASKTGYLEGREALDIDINDESKGIEIVLHTEGEDPEQLSLAALVNTLAPQLRDDAVKEFAQESDQKEFLRGCKEWLDKRNAAKAVDLLNKYTERAPDCMECRLLLSLALFDAGSWSEAKKQLKQVLKINDERTAKKPEPSLVLGILNAWRKQNNEAARLYLNALEADPENILALQELGRSLLELKKYEAAEEYLAKAIKAGADDAARILRIRALLEIGDVGEAAREMERYTEKHDVRVLPVGVRALFSNVRQHLLLLSYDQVNPVTTQSPEELIKAFPGLEGLEVAADQSMLDDILKKTGEGVDNFFKNFPNTVSREQVHQERLKKGEVKASLDQEFQYLLLARNEKLGLGVEEHRSTADGQDAFLAGRKKGLMLTSGFTSVSYMFHPFNRNGVDFKYLGKQTVDGHEAYVVAFAQKPETARMYTRFISDDGSAVILIHGLAWIDTGDFHIMRLHTDLLNPAPEVRLQKQTTEIQYQPVEFQGLSTPLWLPREVKVTVDWRGRILRNRHQYSDFKLFSTESRDEIKTPKIPATVPKEQLQ